MAPELVFNWHEQREGFLKHLIVSSIADARTTDNEAFERLSEATNQFTDVHLTMQISGIEVNPLAFLEGLESHYDWQIEGAAKKLVEDVGLDIDGLYEVARDVEQYARNKLQAFGVEYHEDE